MAHIKSRDIHIGAKREDAAAGRRKDCWAYFSVYLPAPAGEQTKKKT